MDEFTRNFPERLGRLGRLVVKQARGNGGNGVWKVELPGGGRVRPTRRSSYGFRTRGPRIVLQNC